MTIILAALREALRETYVVPAQRQDRRGMVQALANEILGAKKASAEGPSKDSQD